MKKYIFNIYNNIMNESKREARRNKIVTYVINKLYEIINPDLEEFKTLTQPNLSSILKDILDTDEKIQAKVNHKNRNKRDMYGIYVRNLKAYIDNNIIDFKRNLLNLKQESLADDLNTHIKPLLKAGTIYDQEAKPSFLASFKGGKKNKKTKRNKRKTKRNKTKRNKRNKRKKTKRR